MNKFAVKLNLYHLLVTDRVHYMKNTFTTPQCTAVWSLISGFNQLEDAAWSWILRECKHIRQQKKPGNIQCATVCNRRENNITNDKHKSYIQMSPKMANIKCKKRNFQMMLTSVDNETNTFIFLENFIYIIRIFLKFTLQLLRPIIKILGHITTLV